jgi:hypothetical protein
MHGGLASGVLIINMVWLLLLAVSLRTSVAVDRPAVPAQELS